MKKKLFSLALALLMALALLPTAALAANSSLPIMYGSEAFFPYGITSIDERALYLNHYVTGAVIPNGVTSIGNSAFYGCSNLTRVTIPNGITSIGTEAFLGCSSLTSITIPASVTSIGNQAFYCCESLTGITVASGNPNYVSEDGVLYNKDKTELICYPAGKSGSTYTIPSSVTRIGDGAFASCNLTSVTIPSSVTSIGNNAFQNCRSLISVVVPYGVTSIGGGAFADCNSMTSLTIPSSVTSIGQNAFYLYEGVWDIFYSGSMEDWARISTDEKLLINHNLHLNSGSTDGETVVPAVDRSFTIENGVLTKYTGSGGNVTIPDGVTSIGYQAFSGCDGLISVTIPDGVTNIEYRAFSDCGNLTSVTIPNSVTSIEAGAFSCTGLTSVTIPNSVTSIGISAFYDCDSLTSITIPSSVTSIGGYAFYDCGNLTSVTVLTSSASVGANAFLDTPWLENQGEFAIANGILIAYQGSGGSVTIPDSVTSIADQAFYDCDDVTSVTIPNGVTRIGVLAFFECDSLTHVVIPDSVTHIERSAFYGSGLTNVEYGGSEAQWKAIDFGEENANLANATVHYAKSAPDAPASGTAYASTQSIQVDGRAVTFAPYALIDANGGETNYIKLRDVAYILNGSAAQFEVSYDGTINILTGQGYTTDGSEMSTPFSGNQRYSTNAALVKVNGVVTPLEAIVLTDSYGGDYTYFKLRDLGKYLGFNVSWSENQGIDIETNQSYSDAD